MNFGYIHLPREFCFLLQSNMQTSGSGFQYLKKTFWSRPSFQGVLRLACHDMGSSISFERVINSLGWLGLRDRLAACYLHHQQYGRFPKAPTLHDVEEILNFEKKCSSSTVDGLSRPFLLAFYLKMGLLYFQRHYPHEKFVNNWDTPEVFEILKLSKTRVEKIDWLFVSLLHLSKSIDSKRMRETLGQANGHASLVALLSQEKRYEYTRALAEYGASIGDKDVFVNHEV
jgi:hypothetical protein